MAHEDRNPSRHLADAVGLDQRLAAAEPERAAQAVRRRQFQEP